MRTGADRLQVAAEDLQQAANDAGLLRIARIARGYQALAAEAQRVVATHRLDADLAQVDWSRVDGIADGIRRLQAIDGAELGESIRLTLRDHDQQRSRFRISGLEELADRIEIHPVVQVALRQMREFVDD